MTAAGASLHVLALSLGPLVLVQPIGVTGLVFALALAAGLRGRRIHRRDLLSAIAIVVGLATLLLSVQIHPGRPNISETETLVLAIASGLAVMSAALVGRRLSGAPRALVPAMGAAAAYGVASALVRVVAHRAGMVGVEHAVRGWTSVVLVAAAVAGLLLSQVAYQAESLAVALPTLTIVNPVVAIGVGVVLLGEPVRFTRGGGLAVAAGCGLIVLGTICLARSGATEEP